MPYANNYSFSRRRDIENRRGINNNNKRRRNSSDYCGVVVDISEEQHQQQGLMPPEPLPWDRKGEFFRERKHGNGYGYGGYDNGHHSIGGGGAGGGGGGGPGGGSSGGRWRDSSSSSSPFTGSRNNSEFSPRWGFPSDCRRPPGHAKQGGWHMYSEDSPHGYSTPRSGDRFTDEDGFRPAGPRGDGRYGRMYRENRSGFGQRDWRGHSWENNHHHNGPANNPGRQHHVNDQRFVGDSPARPSHSNPDPNGQSQPKDQPDKSGDDNGAGASPREDKEKPLGSLDWKPLKWSRSGSLTSRGSGFSHSTSSSKSTGGESTDVKVELPPKKVTPVQSPSEDAAACAPTGVSSEETSSRKKPRLGWGEGLAKYEKKKVDGPEDVVNKVELAASVCNGEPCRSLSSNLVDKSPKITGFSDCSSPATPSSFACSSSPGLEEKTYGKTFAGDANNFSVSSMPVPEVQPEGGQFTLEKLELNSITNLSSLLSELLQADDHCSVDSGVLRSSALSKLLLWKADISKALELTETEIDSLENELKLLKADSAQGVPCPGSSCSPVDDKDVHLDGQNHFARPPLLDVVSSGNIVEDALPCDYARGAHVESKDAEIDSPGTATSKFVESVPLQKPVNSCLADSGFVESSKAEEENLFTFMDEEAAAGTSCVGDDAKGPKNDVVAVIEPLGLCDVILASNKDIAAKASEALFELLPSGNCRVDSLGTVRAADLTIKEKFLKRKRHLRFKEKILSLKYRAFHHLWKEDLRLLSLRSHRVKPQRKFDLISRTIQIGNQKNRPSIRSRFASPAGSLSLVPTTEILNFTRKLLSNSEVKIYRSSLKMPAMILDEKEKMSSRFESSNGLVEDPLEVEKERALINPWTIEEKETFMEKLAAFGKDFSKIASFLDHKTTADCVEFYYKKHKSKCFKKTKKLDSKKQAKPLSSEAYLVTSEKKWSREMNAASLDILGAASVMAAQVDQATKTSKLLPGKSSNRSSKGSDGLIEASSSFYNVEDERETAAADVLAGICGSLSSEAMSSCITNSVDPGEGNHGWKHQKVDASVRRPLTPDVTQFDDDDTYSDESCGEMDPVDWTDDEKSLFIRAFSSHGKDFLMISRFVRTKTKDQCKVFFSKARKCLGLDTLHPGSCSGGILGNNDLNEGGSDIEDACVMETGSVACSDKSGSRTDEDMPHVNEDVSMPDASVTDVNSSEEKRGPVQSDMEPEVSCPVDNLAESDLGPGGVVDVQCKKSAAANVQSAEGRLITQHDTTMVDAAICVNAGSSPHASSVMDSDAINAKAVSLCNTRDSSASYAPIDFEDFQEGRLKQAAGCALRNPLHGRASTNEGETSEDLKRFPLDLSVEAEMSDVVIHKVGSESKFSSFEGCYLRKCNRSASQNAAAELPLLHKDESRASDHTRMSSSSETEKPSSSGDVKLFGKILSKPSSVAKQTSNLQRHDEKEKAKHHLTLSGKLNMKSTSHDENNKHDQNGFVGLENVPIRRSYGIWDGTKIQTEFPDSASALLLAKHPAAFGRHSSSSPRTEQLPFEAAVNSNECNINGACVFSPREFSSSNGRVVDYPVFRSPEGMQPFTLDVKQRQDVFPIQRNGFETVSSIQPQRKGLVQLNVVQGGDIHGGSCTGISDPVAALRLHYSGQQFGGAGHAANGIVREDSWRGQRDVGR